MILKNFKPKFVHPADFLFFGTAYIGHGIEDWQILLIASYWRICFLVLTLMHFIFSRCPALKVLYLPSVMGNNRSFVLSEVISKWKNLELLKIERPCIHNMEKILKEISLHCKNFCHLEIDNIPIIHSEEASAIVTFLPNIRYLHLRHGIIDQKSLKIILQGCKKLVHLDVRDSLSFECDDQILELASHITNFQHVISEPSCVDYWFHYVVSKLSCVDYKWYTQRNPLNDW